MKKKSSVFLGLILLMFLSSFSFLSADTCTITSKSVCPENQRVMELYLNSNSHAALSGESNYGYVLCCGFVLGDEDSHNCWPDKRNALLELSSSTNAHAEVLSGTAYSGNTVCYSDFSDCSPDTCGQPGAISVVSLTSATNAHVDSTGSVNICCKRSGEMPPDEPYADEMEIYFITSSGTRINGDITASVGDTVYFVVVNPTTEVKNGDYTLSLMESDTGSDDFIKSSFNIDSVVYRSSWTITQADVDAGNDYDPIYPFGENGAVEFYFKLFSGETSYLTPTKVIVPVSDEEPEPTSATTSLVWMDEDFFNEVSEVNYGGSDIYVNAVAYNYSGTNFFLFYIKSYLCALGICSDAGEPDDFTSPASDAGNSLDVDGDGNLDKYFSFTITEDMLVSENPDGNYEFYFKIGDLESPLLTVYDQSNPCANGELDVGEEGIDCGGNCPDACECYDNDACEVGEGADCTDCIINPPNPDEDVEICSDYTSEVNCNDYDSDVASVTPPYASEGESNICYWNTDTESCDKMNIIVTPEGYLIGGCATTRIDNGDTCGDDNFLSYSWTASIKWAANNSFGSLENCTAYSEACDIGTCFEDGAVWRCDSSDLRTSCADGSAVIACSAQVQLDFFDWKNWVAVIVLVFVLYLVLKKDRKRVVKTSKKNFKSRTSKN